MIDLRENIGKICLDLQGLGFISGEDIGTKYARKQEEVRYCLNTENEVKYFVLK